MFYVPVVLLQFCAVHLCLTLFQLRDSVDITIHVYNDLKLSITTVLQVLFVLIQYFIFIFLPHCGKSVNCILVSCYLKQSSVGSQKYAIPFV